MTWRIRAYLAVLTFRYLGVALALVRSDDVFVETPHFRYIFGILPLGWWAVVHVLVGLAALGAVIRPRVAGIRGVLVASVIVTTMWAAGFAAAELVDGTRAALGTIFLLALAAKDFIVSSMHYTNPLETMVRRDEEGGRS